MFYSLEMVEIHPVLSLTYSSTDVIGVECAGAIKTVMALAAGMNASTFMGLAGMGDLMVSCTAAMSRNRRVGISLAQGNSLEKALSSVDQVA